MAWITPITDRPDEDTRTTAVDMNRIANNVHELGGDLLTFAVNDIVTVAQWEYLVDFARLIDGDISYESSFSNLNRIEEALRKLHDGEVLLPSESLYPAEDLYPN